MSFVEEVIKSLIDPLSFSSVLLGIAAALVFYKKKRSKAVNRLIIISFSWLIIWSQPYLVDLLLYPLEYHLPKKIITHNDNQQVDASHIHVLACYYDARQSRPFISRWAECSHQRMIEAVRLHNHYQIPIVITGGGIPEYANESHASFAEQYLLSVGVAKSQIITIEKGTNTATEVASLVSEINPKKLMVVSSATHIYRINKIYEREGVETYFYPVDHLSSGSLTPYLSLPKSNSLESSRRAFYEYLAIIKNFRK